MALFGANIFYLFSKIRPLGMESEGPPCSQRCYLWHGRSRWGRPSRKNTHFLGSAQMKKCHNACSGREGGGWRCYLTRPIKMNVFSGMSSLTDAGARDDILWQDQLYNDILNTWLAVLVISYIRHMR